MPNQPRTDNPARAIRIEDDLWQCVKDRAVETDSTASEVVRTAIVEHLGTEIP